MTEKELKGYYAAYARALIMLQHPETVTEKEIAACVRQTGNSVVNRLFCMAVWQEVKFEKEGKPSMPQGQYKDAITDVWRFFRRYNDGDGSDSYWDGLVEGLYAVMGRYQHCPFIMNLAVHVTLEAIEDGWRKKEGKAVVFPKIRKIEKNKGKREKAVEL